MCNHIASLFLPFPISIPNYIQTNDVFESIKDVARIHTPEPYGESNVERVSETSQDVALLNSEQTLVSTKEKSTKDKVSEIGLKHWKMFISHTLDKSGEGIKSSAVTKF